MNTHQIRQLEHKARSLWEQGYSLLAFLLALFTIALANTSSDLDERSENDEALPRSSMQTASIQRFNRDEAQAWLGAQASEIVAGLRADNIPHAAVYHRVKSEESAAEKAARKHIAPTELNDLYGMRVVVENELDVYSVLNYVCARYTIIAGTMKNYIAHPKPSGYQSVHVTARIDSRPVEFQIRTQAMHRQAEEEHEAYKIRMRS